ncbi:DNA primase [Candidatus Bathyarchaeota archaeon]|nr:DNA primase [Candidatus Bathyarchaeota archaeon]
MIESSSVYTPTTKYIVIAKFEVDGVVEKPDVVGAIFGQTEGLFGPDLDLRELQKSNRIGRIEITLKSEHDKTFGSIKIPSSLDKASTAIIAAAIESIDRIGPCGAKITLEKIEDLREEKRKRILEKAKEILKNWVLESSPTSEEIIKEVSNVIKMSEICSLGVEGLPAGPEASESSSIIIVEGRADVVNLLKCGIKNVIGIEGTKIPQTIIDLCKNKEVTAFLDGDRGGDLILKELLQVAEIDYVARAPPGKEVEELTPKEVMKQLREKIPVEQLKLENYITVKSSLPKEIFDTIKDLKGTLEAVFFDEKGNILSRMPVGELAEKIKDVEEAYYLVFDGIITQRILDLAETKEIKVIIGDRISEIAKIPVNIKVLTFANLNQHL